MSNHQVEFAKEDKILIKMLQGFRVMKHRHEGKINYVFSRGTFPHYADNWSIESLLRMNLIQEIDCVIGSFLAYYVLTPTGERSAQSILESQREDQEQWGEE